MNIEQCVIWLECKLFCLYILALRALPNTASAPRKERMEKSERDPTRLVSGSDSGSTQTGCRSKKRVAFDSFHNSFDELGLVCSCARAPVPLAADWNSIIIKVHSLDYSVLHIMSSMGHYSIDLLHGRPSTCGGKNDRNKNSADIWPGAGRMCVCVLAENTRFTNWWNGGRPA